MLKKAIVIGAGIGGLAIAVRLAARDFQVKLFEANDYPGGKLSELTTQGFRFDAGPSLFTMPELIDELYELAGKQPKEYFNYKRLNNICRYFYEDGTTLTATANPQEFALEAETKTGIDHQQILKHLNKSSFIYKNTASIFFKNRSLPIVISLMISYGSPQLSPPSSDFMINMWRKCC